MKKKLLPLLFTAIVSAMFIAGCQSGPSAEEYAGDKITELKEKDTEKFAALLEEGIAESYDINMYVLEFPDSLKESYMEFLQTAFSSVKFEVASAKKKDNGNYSVDVSFTPLNIKKTVKENDTSYAETMTSADLSEAVSALLTQDKEVIKEQPMFDEETLTTIEVTEENDEYTIPDSELEKLISAALKEYMSPYETVCEILDARDFLQAFLDASFKGEFTQFMKHTDQTEAEAQAWYEADGAFAPPEDLPAAYKERCTTAYKNILKQCTYTIGIPKKEAGAYNYTVEITTTPNNSFTEAGAEFQNGTYYSLDAAGAAYVEIMEKYAAAPVYGEETTVTVPLNMSSILSSGNEESEFNTLSSTICPLME